MLRKAKRLPVMVMSVLIIAFLGSLSGCGDSAADPMGTATVRFVDGSGSVIDTASVVPNGTITLRAKVTNTRSDGTAVPVVNEKVSFSIVNAGNGASLSVVNDRTGSGGEATVLFTSGNSMYSDIVRATTDGSGSTATIHINKTGGMTDPRIETLTASSTTMVAGQTSVITAHVIDGASNPVMSVLVRFRLPVNGSGASFSDAYVDGNFYAYTDVGGYATAVYQAGSNNASSEVYDSVLADLENGSSKAVEIKRTTGTATTTTPTTTTYTVSIGASSTSVTAGQVSVITATVNSISGSTSTPAGGVTVTFTLPVNNSTATLSSATATTDGSGKAVVIYQPGTTNPTLTVQDTVQAAVGTATNAIAITRVGSSTSAFIITVGADPATLTADNSNSVITANVKNNLGTVISGVTVTFTVTGGGTVPAPGTATTDGSGNAVITFTGGPGARPTGETDVVTASITVGVNTYTDAAVITYP